MDDQELAWLLKEGIERPDNDDIDIEKQGLALQAVQVLAKHREFFPAPLRNTGWKIQRRNRIGFDLLAQASRVIGQADKTKWQAQILLDHRIQMVHIF